jgi:predicted transcriptional regulator
MQVLLSIKPEYVDRILSGEKRYEYRRRVFQREGITTVVIYATAPVMRIVGEFEIAGIIEDTPNELWMQTNEHAGVTFEFYDSYFSGREKAFAIRVGAIRRYEPPVEPHEALEDFCAPQSFRYLR